MYSTLLIRGGHSSWLPDDRYLELLQSGRAVQTFPFEVAFDTVWQRLLHLIRGELTRRNAEFEQGPEVGWDS